MKKTFFYLIALWCFAFTTFPIYSETNNEAPVVVFGDTLFYLHTHTGSFSQTERAKNVGKKIIALYKNDEYYNGGLEVIEDEYGYAVVFKDEIIITINPKEAEINNKTSKQFAYEIRDVISNEISKHKQETSLKSILINIGEVLLTIIIAIIIIKLMWKFFGKFQEKIITNNRKLFRGISIKSYHLLNEEQTRNFFSQLIKYIRNILCIAIVYFCLPILFSIFPNTHRLADKLLDYVLNPLEKIYLGFVSYLSQFVFIAVIITVYYFILKFLRFIAKEIQRERIHIHGFYSDWAIPTYNIIKILLFVFVAITIFPLLPGSDSSIFKGISIFVGVILSLGSTNMIGNMIAGLVLTYMRPFQIGDMIKIGDVLGNVIEKTPFVIRIRTQKKEEITIPNASILSTHTINYANSAKHTKLLIYSSIHISYDKQWEVVHKLLIDAAKRVPAVLSEPAPFVLQVALDKFWVEYQINAYIVDVDRLAKIYSDLHQNIQDTFNEAGIEIMSPEYLANRDGNQSTAMIINEKNKINP